MIADNAVVVVSYFCIINKEDFPILINTYVSASY